MKTYTFFHPEKTNDFFLIRCDAVVLGEIRNESYFQCIINNIVVAQFPINWIMYDNSCL